MNQSLLEDPHPDRDEDSRSYILFEILKTHYAISSKEVQHLEMVEHITPLPNASAFVDGVVFSRGEVIPVINMRKRFGFDRCDLTQRTRLLVVRSCTRLVGLLVDSAREFRHISTDDIRPPHAGITELSGNYLVGTTTLKDKIVLILDLNKVLDVSQLSAAIVTVNQAPMHEQPASAPIT